MKITFFCFYAFLFVIFGRPVNGQDIIKNSAVTGVCYAGKKVNRVYYPPPDKYFSKSGKSGNASITVYYTNFPLLAQDAVDHAVSILETILPANTRLTINASWEKISDNGVLGNSSINSFVGGWAIDAQIPLAYYPVALAEKIAGISLNNDEDGDLQLTINSSINWYLGTDGQTPVTKYDLVTVAMHEICHGLGFYDSMNTNESVGWYGIGSVPIIYDTFVENNLERFLDDTLSFVNYSASLKNQMTGGQLYFKGPVLDRYTLGSSVKLWAPPEFDPGSSISHLDEDLTSKENSLMTPYIDLGEAIHNPGTLTFSILGDLGWINTHIVHEGFRDTEEHLTEIRLENKIVSDTSYNHDKVGVVYSFDDFLTSDTIFMNSLNNDDNFASLINIPSYNVELQYYFFAEDYFLRIYRSPSLYDQLHYRVFIGTDTVKPVIEHTPVSYYLETTDSVSFNASVTDNLGIDTVYVEYKIDDGPSYFVGLDRKQKNNFNISLNARDLNIRGGDSIKYRIYAVDSAHIQNVAVLPVSSFFSIPVEGIESVVESYSTDFQFACCRFFQYWI